MEAGDKVGILLVLNDLLELESEPGCIQWKRLTADRKVCLLLHHFIFVCVNDILYIEYVNVRITLYHEMSP